MCIRDSWEKIQAVLRRHDVLMVADEIITGFHRTGNTFACQTYGIEPDIMVVAKQLSSAYMPISAVMLNEKIYGPIRDQATENAIFSTGFTYQGHPVAAAVALETLKIYDDLNIGEHVRAVSKVAQARLSALRDHPIVGDANGVGLIGAVELTRDKATKENFGPEIATWCEQACQNHGVILRTCSGKRLAFCPPLIIEADEVEVLFDRMENGLDDTYEHVKSAGLL